MQFLKVAYNNILSQVFSESGQHLFAGNRFGDIFIIDVEDIEKNESSPPKIQIYSHGKDVNSLLFYNGHLIVGSIGVICAIEWNEELQKLAATPTWVIEPPILTDHMDVPDINSMWLRRSTNKLYAGCGDNNVYEIDLETECIVRVFTGHDDYVHCVTGTDENIFSASEDGTVRGWSSNDKDSILLIRPSEKLNLARPEFGSWVGAVATNSNWLALGGGVAMSLWHWRSKQCTTMLQYPTKIHCCDFIDDSIIVAGESNSAYVYTKGGDISSIIMLENTATYSIAYQQSPIKMFSIAGYCNQLHILKTLQYINRKVRLYDYEES